jgi:predicted PurR-regulated permease PerM
MPAPCIGVKEQFKISGSNLSATTESVRNPIDWMRWIPVVTLSLIVIVLLLISSRVILIPLLTSLALAYLLEPGVEWFEKRGWSRGASVLLTLTAATLVAILALVFVLPGIWDQLVRSYEQLPLALKAGQERIEPLLARLKTASPPAYDFIYSLFSSVKDPAQQEQFKSSVIGWLQSGLFRLFNATAGILDLLLIPFFVYYLLADYRNARGHVDRLIPPRHREAATGLLDQINSVLSAYVRSQLLIAFVMGLLYALGFAILRVPLALTLGLLSGLLNFVPYLGTLSGLVLALSFTALEGAGVWRLAGVALIFVIVQSIEGYYLTPKLMGEKLDLHPLWVLLGLVIAGNLFGLLGIILAVPVMAMSRVVLSFLEDLYQKSNFYRRSGQALVTAEGAPAHLIGTAELKMPQEASEIIVEPFSTERERKVILTTGELRIRQKEKDKSSFDE